MHFVYIIYSPIYDKFYKGYSLDPVQRLIQHNNKESRYTRQFTPWELVFVQSYNKKSEALKREISLKKYSKSQIEQLISSVLNEL